MQQTHASGRAQQAPPLANKLLTPILEDASTVPSLLPSIASGLALVSGGADAHDSVSMSRHDSVVTSRHDSARSSGADTNTYVGSLPSVVLTTASPVPNDGDDVYVFDAPSRRRVSWSPSTGNCMGAVARLDTSRHASYTASEHSRRTSGAAASSSSDETAYQECEPVPNRSARLSELHYTLSGKSSSPPADVLRARAAAARRLSAGYSHTDSRLASGARTDYSALRPYTIGSASSEGLRLPASAFGRLSGRSSTEGVAARTPTKRIPAPHLPESLAKHARSLSPVRNVVNSPEHDSFYTAAETPARRVSASPADHALHDVRRAAFDSICASPARRLFAGPPSAYAASAPRQGLARRASLGAADSIALTHAALELLAEQERLLTLERATDEVLFSTGALALEEHLRTPTRPVRSRYCTPERPARTHNDGNAMSGHLEHTHHRRPLPLALEKGPALALGKSGTSTRQRATWPGRVAERFARVVRRRRAEPGTPTDSTAVESDADGACGLKSVVADPGSSARGRIARIARRVVSV
jgi:hypothetical protein